MAWKLWNKAEKQASFFWVVSVRSAHGIEETDNALPRSFLLVFLFKYSEEFHVS